MLTTTFANNKECRGDRQHPLVLGPTMDPRGTIYFFLIADATHHRVLLIQNIGGAMTHWDKETGGKVYLDLQKCTEHTPVSINEIKLPYLSNTEYLKSSITKICRLSHTDWAVCFPFSLSNPPLNSWSKLPLVGPSVCSLWSSHALWGEKTQSPFGTR